MRMVCTLFGLTGYQGPGTGFVSLGMTELFGLAGLFTHWYAPDLLFEVKILPLSVDDFVLSRAG